MKKLLLSSAAVLGTVSAFAEGAAVTIPSIGVDVGAYATSAITTLGGVVAVCVGGTIAFYLVRAGLRWVRGIR